MQHASWGAQTLLIRDQQAPLYLMGFLRRSGSSGSYSNPGGPGSAAVLRALSAAILRCTSSLDADAGERLRRHWIADRERIRFGATSSRPVFRAGSGPHEIVDSAAGHLDGTFFREYLGDVPIRPTPCSEAPL